MPYGQNELSLLPRSGYIIVEHYHKKQLFVVDDI